MKRKIALLIGVILCLPLAACSKAPVPEQVPQETNTETTNTETTNTESSEAVQQSIELVGPWHLDREKNDLAAFAGSPDLFPGYGEWGASMEIRSNGQMSWYIGTAGGCGTYTLEDDVLHGSLVDNIDQKDMAMDLRILVENEKAELTDHGVSGVLHPGAGSESGIAVGTGSIGSFQPIRVGAAVCCHISDGVNPIGATKVFRTDPRPDDGGD